MITVYEQYVDDVLNEKITAGELTKLACQRHLNDLKEAKHKGFFFDRKAAKHVIDFFSKLRHTKGAYAGKNFELAPFQQFRLASVFGWKNKGTGLRRFRYAYNEEAKKNGKTAEGAGICLYGLLADGEAGAEIYTAATKKDQASIAFNQSAAMAKKLKSESKLVDSVLSVNTQSIYIDKNGSFVQALSKDHERQDGINTHYALIDEYHAHPNSGLFDNIKSSTVAREQPLVFIITTAGFNKMSPCYELRENCIKILRGQIIDDSMFVLIYSLDDEDQWDNKDVWIKANPNLGVTPRLDAMQIEFNTAKTRGGTTEVNFKTKNLNMWTDASEVWIRDEIWKRNTHGITKEELNGQLCYGGLDLAKGTDLNSFVLLFPIIKGKVALLPFFWLPESKVKENRDNIDYTDWVQKGLIRVTKGDVIDHEQIAFDILDIIQSYDFHSMSYDRYIAHHGTVQKLLNEELECYSLGQGFVSLSHPTKEFETLAIGAQFEHFSNPVLSWMLGNVEIKMDPAGNIKPDKGKSKNKIDGIAASINALAQWLTIEAEEEEETPGIFLL